MRHTKIQSTDAERRRPSPNSFEDPDTHELGVNNQLYRAMGCLRAFRGTLESPPVYYFYIYAQVKDSQPVWLITVSGDDLSHDGDVTITFDRALEHLRYNTDGTPRADETYRIDGVDPPLTQCISRTRRLENGLSPFERARHAVDLSTREPAVHERVPNELARFTCACDLMADGSLDSMVGGYQPWGDFYWPLTSSGSESTEGQSLDQDGVVGLLPAQKARRCGPRDPKTGNNALISATYHIKAVPAFAVPAGPPKAVPNTAQTAAPVWSFDGAFGNSSRRRCGKPAQLHPARRCADVAYSTLPPIRGHLPQQQSISHHHHADVFGPDIELEGRF